MVNDSVSLGSVLHIRCGDDILGKLQEAGVPGARIRWADALCQGPTPWGLSPDEWRRIRAQHAAEFYGMPFEQGLQFLADQDEALETYRQYDEVVLWFEHDLFDQVVLIYLLDWFSRQSLRGTRVSLINTDRHLGNMSASELAPLYGTQQPVTEAQISLAHRAWSAFCAPDPSSIEHLILSDTSPLPHLAPALRRHLEEFPSATNGLGRVEQMALEIIASGTTQPVRIFHAMQQREERAWLGDAMFWPYLQQLARASVALLKIEGEGPWPSHKQHGGPLQISVTETGRAVLSGLQDHVRLNGIDRWFGGVHLQGKSGLWRWDPRLQTLTRGN
jgi:hypothetical protein